MSEAVTEPDLALFQLIDAIRADPDAIAARVAAVTSRFPERARAARELVEDAALRSALVNAGSALPGSLPVVGPVGTFAIALFGSALWQLAIEVELVYALAHLYGSKDDPERQRMVAFWLVRLTNFDELRELALQMGVTVTVKKLIEKLLAIGLARGIAAVAGMVGGARALSAFTPTVVAWLAVPVVGVLGWRSTTGVGERAISWFEESAAR